MADPNPLAYQLYRVLLALGMTRIYRPDEDDYIWVYPDEIESYQPEEDEDDEERF